MSEWQHAIHAGQCFNNPARKRDHVQRFGAGQQLDALLGIHLTFAANISNGFNQRLRAREISLRFGVDQTCMSHWPRRCSQHVCRFHIKTAHDARRVLVHRAPQRLGHMRHAWMK